LTKVVGVKPKDKTAGKGFNLSGREMEKTELKLNNKEGKFTRFTRTVNNREMTDDSFILENESSASNVVLKYKADGKVYKIELTEVT
jgi:hypothetical protein